MVTIDEITSHLSVKRDLDIFCQVTLETYRARILPETGKIIRWNPLRQMYGLNCSLENVIVHLGPVL
jgi:hypothetical protein